MRLNSIVRFTVNQVDSMICVFLRYLMILRGRRVGDHRVREAKKKEKGKPTVGTVVHSYTTFAKMDPLFVCLLPTSAASGREMPRPR